ncbi:MAG TPA: alpha/beta hydrolase [Clostridiales bacterium]|nr:alpha/beta hydrolase [Clostridiales bacterium]
MPVVRVGDLEMYYEVMGHGRPLVMIMGLSGNCDWWDPQTLEELGRDFRILIFDNRDAGRTTGPDTPYTIRDMALDTVGLMDRVGFEKAHVLGLSMGGMIAQELALGHPERVDRLVLGCTTPGTKGVAPSAEVLSELLASREGLSLAEVAQRMIRLLFTPEWVEANADRLPEALARLGAHPISSAGYARQLGAISSFDTLDRLRQIEASTLVLHGDRDILVPPENGRILAREIPDARLVILPDCAHGFVTERPDLFVQAVRDFLLT